MPSREVGVRPVNATDWILKLFCFHREDVLKTEGSRMYRECLRCGSKSRGIEFNERKTDEGNGAS
jgi:hypothetical protein